jgi:TPR repeat protein
MTHFDPARNTRLQHMRKHILALGFMASSGVAFADPFDDAIAAYDRGDYATAVRLCRPLAEQGDAQAQNALGAMYYNGKGVAQSFKEAVKWYRLSAAQGFLGAQLNLGAMYYEGEGVTEDFGRAHMWLSIAAAQGETSAVKMRDAVAKEMTAQQLAEAQAMARKCEASNYKQCD